MPGFELIDFTFAVVVGTLFAIVYSLRILVLLERRVASMEANLQRMTARVLAEESALRRSLSRKR